MKNIKLFFYFYFILTIILFFTGLFFDFQISNYFASLENNQYYSLNNFPVIVEIFGEFPFYFLLSFCFVVFCVFSKKIKNKFLKFGTQIIFFLFANGILFLAFLRTVKFAKNYINISFDLLTVITLAIISILICVVFLFLIKQLSSKNLKNLFWFAIMIVIVAIISVLVVQIIKNNLCARPRFRTIHYLNNIKLFKPCWNCFENIFIQNVNLPSDAFQSFPSGHTMTASILLCFVFLPLFFKVKTNTKFLCWFLPVLFIILVAFGRIVAGAHFLTDVSFSAICVGLLYIFVYKFVVKKFIV